MTNLTLLLLGICVTSTFAFAMLDVFFPQEAQNRGIDQMYIGMAISTHPIAYFIISPFVGNYLMMIGRRNTIRIGFSLICLSSAMFSGLYYIESATIFLYMNFLQRLIQGVGTAINDTAILATAIAINKDAVEATSAKIQFCLSLGFCIAPILGSFLFSIGGYSMPLSIVSFACFLVAAFIKLIIPATVETTCCEKKPSHLEIEMSEPPVMISTFTLFRSVRFLLAYVACASVALSIGVDLPYLAGRMLNYGIEEGAIGFFLAIGPLCFGIGGQIVALIVHNRDGRLCIVSGFFIIAFGMCLIGPSVFFELPDSMEYVIAAQVIIGLGGSLLLTPAFVEMQNAAARKINQMSEAEDEYIKNKISGLLGSAFGLGNILGPLASGAMAGSIGLRPMYDIVMAYFVVVGVLTLALNGSLTACFSTKATTNQVKINNEKVKEQLLSGDEGIERENTDTSLKITEGSRSFV